MSTNQSKSTEYKIWFYIKSTKIINVVKFNIKQIFKMFLKQTNWKYKSMYRYVKKRNILL